VEDVEMSASFRFPYGTKYVVESWGPFVRRYVEFPGGHKIRLATRKALTCTCAGRRQTGGSASRTLTQLSVPLRIVA
jgi:hypothetical protein